MIFTSRAPEDYDPEPMSGPGGSRHPHNGGYVHRCSSFRCVYDPRPEFEPTRDKNPWKFYRMGREYSALMQAATPYPVRYPGVWRWEPSDRNRNRILIAFRLSVKMTRRSAAEVARAWLADPEEAWTRHLDRGFLAAEVEHARKVLARLAALNRLEQAR